MGRVILITGAPATGKSTLCGLLSQRLKDIRTFDYGQLLLGQKAEKGITSTYGELREQSARLIAPSDVEDLDEKVIAQISRLRELINVLIDSHAVTRESYGFRAVPFSFDQLQRLQLDAVLVLRCDPEIVSERIAQKPAGRKAVTVELAREHQLLQGALGLVYGVACGCPIYVIDTTSLTEEAVAAAAIGILTGLGLASAV